MERALLIEDNDRNRKLARAALEMAGFDVVSAATGSEGIEAALNGEFDVVLLDIQLPDMDGVRVLEALRAGTTTRSLPVVAVTASAMQSDRIRLLDAGFDGFITKPIDVPTFPDRVREVVTR